MKTRVVQIGNSLGVILPKKTAKGLAIRKGDSLTIHADAKYETLILSKGEKIYIPSDFVRRVAEFSKRYEKDLERLAK